jgi:hypothetical protein
MNITAESLAYWYLILNGFLTTVNFLVHPETKKDFSTEVDILGVRFPNRSENFRKPMKDDTFCSQQPGQIYVVTAEVKMGLCSLNGPWTDPERHNMNKVLSAVGAFPETDLDEVAGRLHSEGVFSDGKCTVSLLCFGEKTNPEVQSHFPLVPQIIWSDIRAFLYTRLTSYWREKAQHSQWNRDGQNLWRCAEESQTQNEFIKAIQVV